MRSNYLGILAFLISVSGVVERAEGHGYLSSPPSRNFLCKQVGNLNCGPIQYEPQSLEALSGYPSGGPADGRIASANLLQFGQLDEQSSARWRRQPLNQGAQTFTWSFTANHVTRNWRYYITRQDWNPNQPLTRSSFEASPFCVVDGKLQKPAMVVNHTCSVPARSGYQIILAVWEIGDTVNSFYNVLDAEFKQGDSSTPVWVVRGGIYPSIDLSEQDVVRTRVFDRLGERSDLATGLTVQNQSEGKANIWAFNLATQINREQTLLKAGQKDMTGEISPVPGINEIYANRDSGIERVEIQIDKAKPIDAPAVTVTGLKSSYPIESGQVTVSFNLGGPTSMDVTATVYDMNQRVVASSTVNLGTGESPVVLTVSPASAGKHQLVVVAKADGSGALLQKTFPLDFEAPKTSERYDYVFPQNLSQYRAGTRVLQSRDGRIYECKPWPYSGYCVQWSSSANQFEPGIGFAWPQAWLLR
jgi:predicted carbohydrate-binding protein with CBM5 and CBM33 domain